MTLEQIANIIDQKNWGFTIYQTKPVYKKMLANAHKEVTGRGFKYECETIDLIKDLIEEHQPDEIQIMPSIYSGSVFRLGAAPAINIKINNSKTSNHEKNNNEMEVSNTQFTALAGLQGMGLNMSDIFTAKDKTQEVIDLKAKVEKLEAENRTLENANRDLGFDLKLATDKNEKKNEFVELLKSPQGISLISAVASKFSPAPALGNPALQIQQGSKTDEKLQWLVNYFNDAETPEMIKDLMIYIAKAQQDENAAMIIKEITELLTTYNIISMD